MTPTPLTTDLKLPTEGVKIQVANTRAFVGDDEVGCGTLCVAESNLIWQKADDTGLCLEYPNIALHAVSTDLASFPHPCLYLILDKNSLVIAENQEEAEDEDDQNDDDEEAEVVTVRFVPEDSTTLSQLFTAMNECQSLYPDNSMSGDEEEGDQDGEEGAEEDDANENGDYDAAEFEDSTGEVPATNGNQEVQLSTRGQEILRRININYTEEGNNASEPTATSNGDIELTDEQYEDA